MFDYASALLQSIVNRNHLNSIIVGRRSSIHLIIRYPRSAVAASYESCINNQQSTSVLSLQKTTTWQGECVVGAKKQIVISRNPRAPFVGDF